MESLLSQYFPILVFLVIAGGIAVAMVAASFVLARQNPNSEKLSPSAMRLELLRTRGSAPDVRYYPGILFTIFDLESPLPSGRP
jgi:NADH-quinone oxidoreductase subunit A